MNDKLKLDYTILCDDVRLEVGNKLSLMGIFQNIVVEQVPVGVLKFAIVQHWRGEGNYVSEVRILSPDKLNVIVSSQPTPIQLANGGSTDNISFFVNAGFPEAGNYSIQTLIDANLFAEMPLVVREIKDVNNADEEFPEMLN